MCVESLVDLLPVVLLAVQVGPEFGGMVGECQGSSFKGADKKEDGGHPELEGESEIKVQEKSGAGGGGRQVSGARWGMGTRSPQGFYRQPG